MIAELGIDDEGRAVLLLHGHTHAEYMMMERLKAFLPIKDYTGSGPYAFAITGDRLPGMGSSVKAQDATSPSVSTEASIARKRERDPQP